MNNSHAEQNHSGLALIDTPTQAKAVATKKWHYLLSNNIRFSDKNAYSVCLPKPNQTDLHLWVEKIVSAGQCERLYIEDLYFDEVSLKRIKQLCHQQGVTLVNLFYHTKSNVIEGPW